MFTDNNLDTFFLATCLKDQRPRPIHVRVDEAPHRPGRMVKMTATASPELNPPDEKPILAWISANGIAIPNRPSLFLVAGFVNMSLRHVR